MPSVYVSIVLLILVTKREREMSELPVAKEKIMLRAVKQVA